MLGSIFYFLNTLNTFYRICCKTLTRNIILQKRRMGSKNNENKGNSSMNIGDISIIKDILIGQEVASIDNKFAELESKFSDAEVEHRQNLATLKKQTTESLNTLDKHFNDKFAEMEKLMNQQVKDLKEQIFNVSKSDKESLASMLQELSSNLIKEEK